MKKILSLLLALSLVFALFAGMAGTASADDDYDSIYYIWDNGDGTCEISCYYGYSYATQIQVPEYINGLRVVALASWCFEGFYNLETLVLPEHLRYIGAYAFSGCQNLKSITIPASVTELNPEAFEYSYLTEINVSSGSRTFSSVNGVLFSKDMQTLLCYPCGNEAEKYTIPNSVKKINDNAFNSCTYLTSVSIPDGVVSIGNNAFSNCYCLNSITLPDSVTECGSRAFEECRGLRNVTLSKNMTEIAPYLFYDALFLYGITIPSNITVIGKGAFECCQNLFSVHLPDSIVSIGDYAFFRCGNYKGINFVLPENLSHIGKEALVSAASISVESENPYFASENGVLFSKDMTKLLQYPTFSTVTSYEIPSTVTEIADGAFEVASNLQSVSMPDSVVSIGQSAFYNSGLISAVISQGVKEIPANAFSECDDLSSVILPDGLTTIGESAFSWCYSLQNITLPNSVQTIGNGAFSYCISLTEMEIPFGVTQINNGLFACCTSLTKLVLPASVGEIFSWAFDACDQLSNIEFTGTEEQWNAMRIYTDWDEVSVIETIPIQFTGTSYKDNLFTYVEDGRCGKIILSGLTDNGKIRSLLEIPAELNGKPIEVIASFAFAESNNREAVLPEGIKILGTEVFANCYRLKKVTLPSTLTYIGNAAFYYCEALQSITIPEGIKELPSALFDGCYDLEDVTLPESLTSMLDGVFYECHSLKSIDLPDQLSDIGYYAFGYCQNLSSLKLPENLKTIMYDAFLCCTALENITFPSAIDEILDEAFRGCSNLEWVYIPEGLSSFGWDVFMDCENLKSIFYEGSYSQWKNIENSDNLPEYTNAKVYFDCNPVVGSFMDVKASDWFKDSVAYVYENELMNGVSDMLFNPTGNLTRGQLVTILYHVAGEPEVNTAADFSDVPSGKFYSNAVAWAAENSIVNGYNDGTFKPDNKITREQIATILYRYKETPDVTGTLDFPDADIVSNYAKNAMTWAVSQNLINGIKSNGITTLAPKNNATRAQIATIIMRYLEAE